MKKNTAIAKSYFAPSLFPAWINGVCELPGAEAECGEAGISIKNSSSLYMKRSNR